MEEDDSNNMSTTSGNQEAAAARFGDPVAEGHVACDVCGRHMTLEDYGPHLDSCLAATRLMDGYDALLEAVSAAWDMAVRQRLTRPTPGAAGADESTEQDEERIALVQRGSSAVLLMPWAAGIPFSERVWLWPSDEDGYDEPGVTPPQGVSDIEAVTEPVTSARASLDGGDDGSEDVCPICLDPLASTPNLRSIRSCRHLFCDSCIRCWLERARTCPVCKTVLEQGPREDTPPPPLLEPAQSLYAVYTVYADGNGDVDGSNGDGGPQQS